MSSILKNLGSTVLAALVPGSGPIFGKTGSETPATPKDPPDSNCRRALRDADVGHTNPVRLPLRAAGHGRRSLPAPGFHYGALARIPCAPDGGRWSPGRPWSETDSSSLRHANRSLSVPSNRPSYRTEVQFSPTVPLAGWPSDATTSLPIRHAEAHLYS